MMEGSAFISVRSMETDEVYGIRFRFDQIPLVPLIIVRMVLRNGMEPEAGFALSDLYQELLERINYVN